MRWEKIKNTEGPAMSVGLLVARLKYGLYVGHLSKWFVFVFNFQFLVVCLWLHCRLLGLLITFRAQAHTLFGLRLCAVMPSIKLIYYTILSIEDPFVVQPIVLIYSLRFLNFDLLFSRFQLNNLYCCLLLILCKYHQTP